MKKVAVFKITDDEWYSEFKIEKDVRYSTTKLVSLSVFELPTTELYRVAVWGNDDLGIDKDFEKQEDAMKLFYDLCSLPTISKNDCLQRGMNYF